MTKASDMTLMDLQNFSNDSGENFLRDRRMIIMSADAWGVLSRDLIVALGIERAKRFLLRYGWHCGVNEAQILKEMFNWDDDLEWILAGSRMHNISGRVFSVAGKLNINKQKGLFDVEGYWINSYEAKQFLRHFPPHHEPVCYFLVGYAGGYCSESVGKKIIFKEVECVGKGDKHCRYVGKTVELWGDDIAEDLIDYEQEDLADELDRAYKRIEKQKEILKLGSTISQELTQIILQGKGLDVIVKTLGESLNCGVTIENQHFETIVRYGNDEDCRLKKIIEQSNYTKDKQHAKIRKMLEERCTVQLQISEPWSFPHVRLVSPIVIRDQIHGFISLIKTEGTFGELEPVLLDRTASICALQILNERTAIETEQRMKGELLDELFNRSIDTSYACRRLSYLGYNLNEPHYVVVFQFELPEQKDQGSIDSMSTTVRNKFIDVLTRQLEQAGYRLLFSTSFERVHALVPKTFLDRQNVSLREYGETLLTKVGQSIPTVKMLLGISDVCQEISTLHNGFRDALKAIEIAKVKGKDKQVVLSSDLGHLGILLDARRPEELDQYSIKILGSLYEYDRQYKTEFLKTLHYYLDNECNLYKTSRAMNVSISGMRYRLRRIKELSNIDLTSSVTRFEAQLALQIFLVFGKVKF